MAMTKCPECNAEFERTGDFCPVCGFALILAPDDAPKSEEDTDTLPPGESVVPIVVGLTEADATARLKGASLHAARGEARYSDQPEGVVLEQNPAAGSQVPTQTTVALILSLGEEKIRVPLILRVAQADARAQLEQAGLLANVTSQYCEDAEAGLVIDQTPFAGDAVSKGAVVSVVVSLGPQPVVMAPPPPAPKAPWWQSAGVRIALAAIAAIGAVVFVWAMVVIVTTTPKTPTGIVINPPPQGPKLGDRELSFNAASPMTGEDVKQLQAALTAVECFSGPASGTFDAATETGVKTFQRAAGLSTDGKVTADVAAILLAAEERSAGLRLVDATSLTAAASTTLKASSKNNYDAKNVLDGNPATAWNENAKGPGTGQWITVKSAAPVKVGRIDIVNGYAKSDEVWGWNARVRDVTVVTDAGSFRFMLLDSQEPQFILADFGETSSVKITVDSVYPGNKYEDLAISEIGLWAAQ